MNRCQRYASQRCMVDKHERDCVWRGQDWQGSLSGEPHQNTEQVTCFSFIRNDSIMKTSLRMTKCADAWLEYQ